MMNEFFTQLARQSLTGGWMILALILLRPLIKKLPRWISCLLWALAAVRLVMPFSLESKMSLVPQRIAAPTQITPIIANIPMAQPGVQAAAPAAAQPFSWQEALPVLWLIGGAVMVIYALVSYIRILKRVQVSIRVGDKLYLCDQVRSPFILGIFRPRIYLPSDMDEATTRLVLSHERTHLRRGDHLWKPLGYALLSVYWFNPLCALAYILFCRDIEQACDEAVIKNMTPGDKKAYSAALLQCSLPGHAIAACPLAFGEVGVKQRIQGVLNYRKPKFWVMILSAVLCTVLAVGFLTDPAEANEVEAGVTDSAVLQEYPVYSSPSEDARILYQLVPGQDYTILSTQPIGDCLWAYVECQDGKTHGWMILGQEISQDILNSPGELGIFTQQTKIYSSPSLQSRELAQGEVGEAYALIRREPIGDSVWGYVECQDGKTFGWILLEESEAQPQRQEIVVYRNPSEDSVIVCTLMPDEDYTILETQPIDNHIWGEVECQDGKTQGWILLAKTLDTVITGTVSGPDNVNVRSGPGTLYRTMGYLEPGTEVSIFEVVTSDNLEWGRISGSGWVCMRYIEHGDVASQDTEITYNSASNASTESYTFSQETNVYSSPSEQGRIIGQAAAGEVGTITRREFIGNGSWAYLTCQSSGFQGWVHLTEEDEALNYFREYVDAYSQPEPDEVEKHLYFSSEYAREFFRDNYCPITGWYPSGIFRVNNNLWGIQFSDPASGRMVYSFVGRMDERLYVFQNVRQVPEALSENLDVARYEEENAMYLSDEYMECYSVIKQLLPFANPTYVTVEDKGTKDYSTASPCPIEDVICGTDTWRVVPEPRSYGSPSCIITLAARDGSVATICDSSPVIAVSSAEGTQQWYQGYLTGEELVGMLYSWAKEIEWAPGE